MCTMCTRRATCLVMCVGSALDDDHAQSAAASCRRSIGCCRLERKRSIRQLARRVDAKVAMDVVDVHGAALAAGRQSGVRAVAAADFRSAGRGGPVAHATSRFRTAAWAGNTCEARCGSAAPAGEVLLSRETHRVALAINSFEHAGRWRDVRLVDVGAGNNASRRTKARTSKARWCWRAGRSAPAWQQAVRDAWRGRRDFDRPRALHAAGGNAGRAAVGQHSRSTRRCKSFGFKATPRVAARLRDALAKGAGHRARRHRDDVPSPAEPHAGASRFPAARSPSSAWCWPPTCRSRARTTTPAAAARCWPRRWRMHDAIRARRVAARRRAR